MTQYPRYAVYFVPSADSALYRFGATLLGYDSFSGAALPFADGIEMEIDGWKSITADPRKYGFHATLKAPMSLADGRNESQLIAAMQSFARTPREIPTIKPTVQAVGSFIAIVPEVPSSALQELASCCTTEFDDFRAPMTEQDRARRNVAALTQPQTTYLDRWGYPYVFDEFRFHMTLTGSLAMERAKPILDIIKRRFNGLGLDTFAVSELALLRQDSATSGFTVISHNTLQPLIK